MKKDMIANRKSRPGRSHLNTVHRPLMANEVTGPGVARAAELAQEGSLARVDPQVLNPFLSTLQVQPTHAAKEDLYSGNGGVARPYVHLAVAHRRCLKGTIESRDDS